MVVFTSAEHRMRERASADEESTRGTNTAIRAWICARECRSIKTLGSELRVKPREKTELRGIMNAQNRTQKADAQRESMRIAGEPFSDVHILYEL